MGWGDGFLWQVTGRCYDRFPASFPTEGQPFFCDPRSPRPVSDDRLAFLQEFHALNLQASRGMLNEAGMARWQELKAWLEYQYPAGIPSYQEVLLMAAAALQASTASAAGPAEAPAVAEPSGEEAPRDLASASGALDAPDAAAAGSQGAAEVPKEADAPRPDAQAAAADAAEAAAAPSDAPTPQGTAPEGSNAAAEAPVALDLPDEDTETLELATSTAEFLEMAAEANAPGPGAEAPEAEAAVPELSSEEFELIDATDEAIPLDPASAPAAEGRETPASEASAAAETADAEAPPASAASPVSPPGGDPFAGDMREEITPDSFDWEAAPRPAAAATAPDVTASVSALEGSTPPATGSEDLADLASEVSDALAGLGEPSAGGPFAAPPTEPSAPPPQAPAAAEGPR
ncbi:MAG: hypothetical protein D6729_14210, partial [Deltaproteobacteria bacterium]